MMNVDKTQIGVDGNIIEPEEFHFDLVCNKCGSRKTRLIPTSYYDSMKYTTPDKITLHMLCTECHSELEYIIFTNRGD